jgi:head-tail adaptor
MSEPGSRNRRVELKVPAATTVGSSGGITSGVASTSPASFRWASIEPTSGRALLNSQQEISQATATIGMAYDSSVTTRCQLWYTDPGSVVHKFQIISVNDWEMGHRDMELLVTEVAQ